MRHKPKDFGLGFFVRMDSESPNIKLSPGWKILGAVMVAMSIAFSAGLLFLLMLAVKWLSGQV